MGQDCRGVFYIFNFLWIYAQAWDCWVLRYFCVLFFKWPSILFSLLDEPMYIVINSAGGFPCLYTLSSIYSFLFNFNHLSLVALGLDCRNLAFSICSEWGLLSSFTVQASHCGGFWLQNAGSRAPGFSSWGSCSLRALELRLSSCGTWALWPYLRGIFWDHGSNPCLLHLQAHS